RNWLFSLMRSLADKGRSFMSVNVAQIAAVTAQLIQCGFAVLTTLVGKNADQRVMDVLRHRGGIAADVNRGAVLNPGVQFSARIPQRMLHIALVRLITGKRD